MESRVESFGFRAFLTQALVISARPACSCLASGASDVYVPNTQVYIIWVRYSTISSLAGCPGPSGYPAIVCKVG